MTSGPGPGDAAPGDAAPGATAADRSEVATLEIGGTHVAGARVDTRTWEVVTGTLHRFPVTGGAGAEQIVGQLLVAADAVGARAAMAWGIAIPGPFDYRRGVAHYSGVGKFDALHGHDLGATLSERIASRPGAMTFLNDAEAYLVGEWLRGAATGSERCVGITVGTGVGSAFLADGRLVDEGPTVPPDGRLHHVIVDGRPLEDLVSRRAIRRGYHDATSADAPAARPAPSFAGGTPTDGPDAPDVAEIAELARNGDRTAGAVLDTAFRLLGTVIAPWLQAFRADVVVVGGAIARSWDLMGGPLQEGLSAGGAGATTLQPASHPDTSALVGAAWAAIGPGRARPVPPRPAPA